MRIMPVKTNIEKRTSGLTVYQLLLVGYVTVSVINSSVISLGPVMTGYNLLSIATNSVLILVGKKYKGSAYLWMMLSLLLFGIAAYTTGNIGIIAVLFFVFAADGDLRAIVKAVLIPELVSVLAIVSLTLLNVLPDYTYYHDGVLAHSYGFYYYSSVPIYFYFCSIMFIYLRNRKLRVIEAAALLAIHYAVYRVFTVRATFYLGILSVVLFYIANYKGIRIDRKWIQIISSALFPLAEIISVMICKDMYTGSSPFWREVNALSSNRISQGHYAFERYPITLFGQRIEMRGSAALALGTSSESYFYIDSGFIYSILVYGVAVTVLVLLAYSAFVGVICRNNEVLLLFWMISICLFSLINNALISIVYCPILLGGGQLLVVDAPSYIRGANIGDTAGPSKASRRDQSALYGANRFLVRANHRAP